MEGCPILPHIRASAVNELTSALPDLRNLYAIDPTTGASTTIGTNGGKQVLGVTLLVIDHIEDLPKTDCRIQVVSTPTSSSMMSLSTRVVRLLEALVAQLNS